MAGRVVGTAAENIPKGEEIFLEDRLGYRNYAKKNKPFSWGWFIALFIFGGIPGLFYALVKGVQAFENKFNKKK